MATTILFSRWWGFGILLATIPLVGWAALPWLWSASGTLRTLAVVAFCVTAGAVFVPRLYCLLHLPLTVLLLLLAALARGFELDPLWGAMSVDDARITGWMYSLPLTLLATAVALGVAKLVKPSWSRSCSGSRVASHRKPATVPSQP